MGLVERPTRIGIGLVVAVFGLLAYLLFVTGVWPRVLGLVGVALGFVAVVGAFWLGSTKLAAWMRTHEGSPRVERVRTIFAHTGTRVGLALLTFPVGVAFMLALHYAMSGTSTGSLIPLILDNFWQSTMWTGFALVFLAPVHHGRDPCCAKCQYTMEGAPEGGYDVCPECGRDLRAKDAIAKGHKTIIKPMMIAGIALVIASFATIGRFSRGSSGYLPYLPTGSLIKEVTTAPRGFTSDEWKELLTRTLTSREVEILFEGMLGLRDTKGYFAREAEGWLDRTALARAVPADVVERYYEGMLSVWIAAPESVSRGEPRGLRFGFGGDFQGNLHVPAASVLQVFFVPESLTVDGEPADMQNDPRHPIPGISMNTTNQGDRGAPRDGVTPASHGPTARVDASRYAGDTIELRGTGWLYVAPHGTPAPSAGAITPVGAVWVHRVDVRETVRIEN